MHQCRSDLLRHAIPQGCQPGAHVVCTHAAVAPKKKLACTYVRTYTRMYVRTYVRTSMKGPGEDEHLSEA